MKIRQLQRSQEQEECVEYRKVREDEHGGKVIGFGNKMVLWSEKRHTVCFVDFHPAPCSPDLCVGFFGPVSFFCSPSQLLSAQCCHAYPRLQYWL